METITILSDQPIGTSEESFFGFKNYSETLKKAIFSTQKPLTLGIFGNWGTGKSSLMRMIFNDLQNKDNFFPVWFDAWRFQNEPNLLVPLLYTVRDEIYLSEPRRKSQNPITKFGDYLDTFLRALASGLEVGFKSDLFSATYGMEKSLEAARTITGVKKNSFLPSSIQYDIFAYLRRTIRDISPQKFVIFIDDLDRCGPEKILSVLESIQLIMNTDGFIFVIGADREMLEKSVKIIYGEKTDIDGGAFLKKIFQVFFTLPSLRIDDTVRYIEELLKNSPKEDITPVARIFAFGAGPNPREIKRLVNNYYLTRSLLSPKTKSADTALFIVIQQRWPLVFQNIASNKIEFLNICTLFLERKKRVSEYSGDDQIMMGKIFGKNAPLLKKFFIDPELLKFFAITGVEFNFTEDQLNEYLHFTSVASPSILLPSELTFIDMVENSGDKDNPYRWIINPLASSNVLERVDKVIYYLPASSYANSMRVTTKLDNFSTSGLGRSNIPVRIMVYLRSGELMEFMHYIDVGVNAARHKRQIQ